VLYDQILALFEDDPKLFPRDILIMAPDIETYAPLVQAVFETSSGDQASNRMTIGFPSPLPTGA